MYIYGWGGIRYSEGGMVIFFWILFLYIDIAGERRIFVRLYNEVLWNEVSLEDNVCFERVFRSYFFIVGICGSLLDWGLE